MTMSNNLVTDMSLLLSINNLYVSFQVLNQVGCKQIAYDRTALTSLNFNKNLAEEKRFTYVTLVLSSSQSAALNHEKSKISLRPSRVITYLFNWQNCLQ